MIQAINRAAAAMGGTPVVAADGPTQAHEDGYDISQGDPDYWSAGDRDSDCNACES
jgi:hypothetical protein